MRLGMRHLHNQFRKLHDFLYIFNRNRVFLLGNIEAHQVQLAIAVVVCFTDQSAHAMTSRQSVLDAGVVGHFGEFTFDQLLEIEHHHHRVARHVFDQAGQQIRINRAADAIHTFHA